MGLWTDIRWKLNRPWPDFDDYRKPPENANVAILPRGYTIESAKDAKHTKGRVKDGVTLVIDGEWKTILDCRNQKGDGGSDEHQDPVARVMVRCVFRRFFIRNVKNAIMFYKPGSTIEECVFLDVGEDAVSLHEDACDFTARDIFAINHRKGGDKIYQFNQAHGLTAERLTAVRCRTGMRIGDSSYNSAGKDKAKVSDCRFVAVDTCFNLSACTADLDLSSHTFDDCRLKVKTANGARLV